MPLASLLYRCPRCGHDPTSGEGDEAYCASCDSHFSRGRQGATIRIVDPVEGELQVPAGTLTRAIEAFGGALTAALGPDGEIDCQAEAARSRSLGDRPVLYRGRLVGFSERQDEPERGIIHLTRDKACFLIAGEVVDRWPLLEIRALQSASSVVQLSLAGDELIQLRFPIDSPRRWEALFKYAIENAWERAGRGRIMEFQPRIATR